MNRRRFLAGACGAVVGLPVLESLRPRSTWASVAPGNPRFVTWFNCNGVNMDRWFPTGNYGPLTPSMLTGTALEPLSAFTSKMLIPRGIHQVPRGWGWDPSAGCDHQKGMGIKLTARPLSSSSGYAEGISLDQHVANHLHPGQSALNLSVGAWYGSPTGHISSLGDSQPVTGENNPWLAYQDLFGGIAEPGSEAEDRLVRRRQSVLDLVRPEYEALLARPVLSTADRQKLDMHFQAIRDLENGSGGGVIPCSLEAARANEIAGIDPETVTYDSEYKTIGLMQMDILAIAIACGATRSATLQWGSGAGGPVFDWDGIDHDYNHHKLSHGNTQDDCSGAPVAGYLDMLFDIDRWHSEQLAYLVQKLEDYSEGAGTVLDQCCLLYANELSDGLGHAWWDLPFILFGSCNGYFRQGEYALVTHVGWTDNDIDAPHNKLLTTISNAMGIPETHFGEPSVGADGEFEELKA